MPFKETINTFLCVLLFFLRVISAQEVTFLEHIAPIIQQHCYGCHQEGNIAPMPLTNYEEVAAYASMIGYVTKTRYMPPWQVIHSDVRIADERKLSDSQIELIQQWLKDGIPKGESQGERRPVNVRSKMSLKDADVTYAMSESFEQYGVYYDQFKVFVIPTNLEEGRYVEGIEFVPGNKSIVRACYVSVDTSEKMDALDIWDPTYGYFSFGEIGFVPWQSRWYNWHPAKGATFYSKGKNKYLPKGAKILLHIHYGPTGQPLPDSSYLKIRFAKSPKPQLIHTAPLIHPYILTNPPFAVPANEVIRFHAKFTLPFDIQLRSIFPHSHLLGHKWEVFASGPGLKKPISLLKIKDWDFNFKQQYDYKTPVLLKKGTVIHALAEYDNTSNNLSNPSDPPRAMVWGKRMFEELFLVYFDFVIHQNTNENFHLSPALTLLTTKEYTFELKTKKKGIYTVTLHDFEGELSQTIVNNIKFSSGLHTINVSLTNLPFGNYFLKVVDTKGGEVLVPFIFVAENLFD